MAKELNHLCRKIETKIAKGRHEVLSPHTQVSMCAQPTSHTPMIVATQVSPMPVLGLQCAGSEAWGCKGLIALLIFFPTPQGKGKSGVVMRSTN